MEVRTDVVTCVCVLLFAAVLSTGCNLQVSVSSAEAAPQVNSSVTAESIGGLEPGSEIQNQLMHSYTHDAMSDFIISNSGAQRRGF